MLILPDFIDAEASPQLLVGRLGGEKSSGAGSKLHYLCLDWISRKPEMFPSSCAILIRCVTTKPGRGIEIPGQ